MAEDSYEVIDKRKVSTTPGEAGQPAEEVSRPAGDVPEPAAEPTQSAGEAEVSSQPDEEPAEPPEAADKEAGEGNFQIPPELLAPDLPVLIVSMVQMLASQAWWLMGLTANPRTGRIEKEMPKAKLAIDCVQFMVDRVAPLLDETVRRELRHRLADLQINFVEQGRNA
ncbi:MAG TPA: DUF1844 domain-containing protein [Armatimonadota bacterium]